MTDWSSREINAQVSEQEAEESGMGKLDSGGRMEIDRRLEAIQRAKVTVANAEKAIVEYVVIWNPMAGQSLVGNHEATSAKLSTLRDRYLEARKVLDAAREAI